MDDREHDQLIEDVVLGRRVETFLGSDVGQYLLQRIINETTAATDKLIVVDPTDWKEVQKLQNKITVTSSIKGWLEDVLVQSLEAENRLNEEE
jgi:hypothetical protein